MSTAASDVITPTPNDADELAKVRSFIDAHDARHDTSPEPAFFLSGASEHDRVELTEQLHEILKRVVHALSHGQSISILTRDQEISTQQAARSWLSRPTALSLIEDGELPARAWCRPAKAPTGRRSRLPRGTTRPTQSLHHRKLCQFDHVDDDEVSDPLADARREH